VFLQNRTQISPIFAETMYNFEGTDFSILGFFEVKFNRKYYVIDILRLHTNKKIKT